MPGRCQCLWKIPRGTGSRTPCIIFIRLYPQIQVNTHIFFNHFPYNTTFLRKIIEGRKIFLEFVKNNPKKIQNNKSHTAIPNRLIPAKQTRRRHIATFQFSILHYQLSPVLLFRFWLPESQQLRFSAE